MKLTNCLDLPAPLVDAIRNDTYNRGECDYSITGLIKPARISALESQHWDEIEEDASDRIWSLMGQIVHGILERAEIRTGLALAETRLFADLAGKRISGQIDRFVLKDGHLQDYKVTTIYKVEKGCPQDFIEQLNAYIWLLSKHGYETKTAEIVAILRDWHRGSAIKNEAYPQRQVTILSVPIWSLEKTEHFLVSRIEAHEIASRKLPLCSDKDRWATPDMWAVIKPGNKRAVKLCKTELEAKEHIAAFGPDTYKMEYRRGESKRCENGYCAVSNFCEQYRELRYR